MNNNLFLSFFNSLIIVFNFYEKKRPTICDAIYNTIWFILLKDLQYYLNHSGLTCLMIEPLGAAYPNYAISLGGNLCGPIQ